MTPESPAQRVAAEVRAALARQGRPQKYVGEVLLRASGKPMSRSAITRRLSGEVPFDVDELHRLSVALGVPLRDFMVGAA